jgi:two-component system, NtrC family, sensor kinase
MNPLDLSYRHKIPLWGGLLVVMTALAVSVVLMIQTYDEMKEDLVINAATLAHALEPEVLRALSSHDVWRAHEVISSPLDDDKAGLNLPGAAENIIVVDNHISVFAAAYPGQAQAGESLESLGSDFAVVAQRLRADTGMGEVTTVPGSGRMFYISPVAEGGKRLGALVVVLTKGSFIPRFFEIARYGLLAAAVLLGVLLPFNWYWGRRMAEPLVKITERMREIGTQWPEELDPRLYTHKDEIGSLFQTYNKMLVDLKEKAELERQVVHADRLAALGQLAAGVAHEINNPLGGMLMAIDTLKSQTIVDARTAKTIALLERGLDQIKETVSALLVEAKVKSRNLSQNDIEDVLVLVLPQVHKKGLRLDWQNEVDGDVALPATLVRQVLINLLLNAIQAATMQGQVACHVRMDSQQLHIAVANDGKLLSPEEMGHLFEPFSPLSEDGHGLGLWVSYQVVHQLGGEIVASRGNGQMHFAVELPLGDEST